MYSADAGATRLRHLAADVSRQLFQVVVRIRDHAATTSLEREQLGGQRFDPVVDIGIEKEIAIAVLGVGVHAEIDATTELGREPHDRHDLLEVVALDDRVEANAVDALCAHRLHGRENPRGEPGDAACPVVAAVEIVERDVELIDPRVRQRSRSLGRQHAAVRQQDDVLQAHGARDSGDEGFQVAPQQGLAARERYEHGIEKPGGVRVALQLVVPSRRIRLPVVAEGATRVAAQRHLEVHEHGHAARGEPGVLREEERNVVGFETRAEHSVILGLRSSRRIWCE